MKALSVTIPLLVAMTIHVPAATLYVSLASTNPVPPFASWSTAATNIQDAVDTSSNGDLILVTNGVYATGGRTVNGYALTNRVVMDKAVTVQSINGPSVTIIQGYQVSGSVTGDAAVRCVFLTNSAILSGFTLTNGATRGAAGDPKLEQPGGGAYCESSGSVISNCVLVGNAAYLWGGGAIYGSLYDCVIQNNSANSGGGTYLSKLYNCRVMDNTASGSGGGAARGTLNNCTLTGNSAATYGGGFDGSSDGTLNNCIVYFNSAPTNANYYRGSFNAYGSVNYCCTVPYSTNGPGNITSNPAFVNPAASDFHLQSNSPCINAGNNAYVIGIFDLDGKARIVNGTVDIGAYEYQGNVRYVSLNSTNPIFPYSDWSIAATNIQDAVDAASAGDTVLVTNGVYATGGWALGRADVTNRVTVTNAVLVQSVNGPAMTVIQGYQVADTSAATNAVRCAYLGNGAMLSGFTLTGGEAGTGNYVNGGGVSGAGTGAVVSNCVLSGNLCAGTGGGAFRVTLTDCVLTRNQGEGGGAASSANLAGCVITNNTAGWAAGMLGCNATDCVIADNSATNYGGGSGFSTLVNCTVAANSLAPGHGGNGGGSYNDTLFNCIVYNNAAPNGSNYYSSGMQYCCTAPDPGGTGNITNAPLFVNPAVEDFCLSSNSPCINSGNNAYVTSATDLDGNPRVVGGTVDIGAYEYQTPVSMISYAWLQQYGLPITSSTDTTDPDGDGLNNYQEWIAGTNPTNALSVLTLLPPAPTNNPEGLVISWQSVDSRAYFLQSGTNSGMQPAFTTIQSNITGRAGTTSYTDTNAGGNGPFFYRVGVQQ